MVPQSDDGRKEFELILIELRFRSEHFEAEPCLSLKMRGKSDFIHNVLFLNSNDDSDPMAFQMLEAWQIVSSSEVRSTFVELSNPERGPGDYSGGKSIRDMYLEHGMENTLFKNLRVAHQHEPQGIGNSTEATKALFQCISTQLPNFDRPVELMSMSAWPKPINYVNDWNLKEGGIIYVALFVDFLPSTT